MVRKLNIAESDEHRLQMCKWLELDCGGEKCGSVLYLRVIERRQLIRHRLHSKLKTVRLLFKCKKPILLFSMSHL